MKQDFICLLGCILYWCLSVLFIGAFLGYPYIENWYLPNAKWIKYINIFFIVICFIIGIGIFKLNLDCLFLKYEQMGITQFERVLFAVMYYALIGVVLFGFLTAIYFNVTGVKALSTDIIHYFDIPGLALANLLTGFACFLSYQYYQVIK